MRLVVFLVMYAGVPAMLAGFLVWQLSGAFTSKLSAIGQDLATHAVSTSLILEEEKAIHLQSLAILRQVCVNSARNDEARTSCLK